VAFGLGREYTITAAERNLVTMAYENGSHPRRSFLRGAAGALGLGFWADETLDALPQNTNTNSKPSDLKITDMRALTVRGAPMTCPIIRIDTNQGIYGLGEVRDGARG
jgi:hypothetical protein